MVIYFFYNMVHIYFRILTVIFMIYHSMFLNLLFNIWGKGYAK